MWFSVDHRAHDSFHTQGDHMKKLTTLLALGLLLAACGSTDASGNSAFGEVTAEGSLAPLSDPASDPAVGQPAPSMTGVDRTGAAVTYTPGGGSPSLVVFLAHWCPHCQNDLPLLVDWLEANPDRLGIDVTAVATGTDGPVPTFLRARGSSGKDGISR
jgi:thiol-disulfide isomerase/thioredoxin